MVLIRGINVGGKNKVPMADLKACLEELEFTNVSTYIASGNVVLASNHAAAEVQSQIQAALPDNFELDDELIRVLVLTQEQFRQVIENRPSGFGDQPETYHSDVIFLIGIEPAQAISVFNPREGVDTVWPGDGVIYSQRLSAQLTKSRFSKIVGTPEYKFMTIRNWRTTTKLWQMVEGE